MSFCVVIPARLASSRLPDKVLLEIAGRPMIAHVIQAARASQADAVIVATDSSAVAAAATAAGARAVITRADHVCGTDRIAEVAGREAWGSEVIVVNVQADEPMMPPALIDQVARALIDDPAAAIATVATPIETLAEFANPNVVKVVVNARGRALYFSRAPIPFHRDSANQHFAGTALRHLGIYAYRADALRRFSAAPPGLLEQHESLEQLRAFELDLPIALVRAIALPGPGVDTEDDLRAVAKRMESS